MGRRSNSNQGSESPKFVEFNYSSEVNDASGRVWLPARETDASCIYGLSLTLNGLTIKNCSLFFSKNNAYDPFIKFPEYVKKDGSKASIIFFTEKDDLQFMSDLAKDIICKL